MKIFFANKNMTFIEWKYFYQILLLFGNHKSKLPTTGVTHALHVVHFVFQLFL